MQKLIEQLHEIGAIKFGAFTLKTGIVSPIYLDLRLIVSYPNLLKEVGEMIWKKIQHLDFDLLCGVPYTALPIATAISLAQSQPMVMRRKEIKGYGTKKSVEGNFHPGQRCLIIEDLVTSGSSIFETITPLENEGLLVEDIAVFIDREQGGKKHLKEKGYDLHAACTLSFLLDVLEKGKRLDSKTCQQVKTFLQENPVK